MAFLLISEDSSKDVLVSLLVSLVTLDLFLALLFLPEDVVLLLPLVTLDLIFFVHMGGHMKGHTSATITGCSFEHTHF